MMLDRARVRQSAEKLTKLLVFGLPFFLPAYLIRLKLFWFPTTFLEIYIGLIVLFFSLAHGRDGWLRAGAKLGKWRGPIFLWSLISFAATFWSPNVFSGLGLWRAYVLEPVLLLFVFLTVLTERADAKRFLRQLYFVVIGICLWAVWQFTTGEGIPSPWNVSIAEGRRATGPFPFPNAVALFVVPITALAAAQFVKHKDQWALVALTAGFISVILAKSDGGLIALTAASAFALATVRWGRVLLAPLIVIGMLIFTTQPALRTKVIDEVTFQTWPGQVRLTIWEETWNMLKDRPILGAGLAGYSIVFADYHEATYIEIFQYPHNILFNVWSETGILGVFAFGWILWVWATHKGRRDRLHIASVTVLLALLIHGLVDVPYFKNDLAIVFWALVFLTVFSRIDENESES